MVRAYQWLSWAVSSAAVLGFCALAGGFAVILWGTEDD